MRKFKILLHDFVVILTFLAVSVGVAVGTTHAWDMLLKLLHHGVGVTALYRGNNFEVIILLFSIICGVIGAGLMHEAL